MKLIKVVLAEDSRTTQQYLVELLNGDPEIQVVGVANNGKEAVEQVERLRPDLVLMDALMPHMDGFQATRRIMQTVPTPILIISASIDPQGLSTTFNALEAGAVAIAEKPSAFGTPKEASTERRLLKLVKTMAGVRVIRRWARQSVQREPEANETTLSIRTKLSEDTTHGACNIHMIAMGASTGGPATLCEILRPLPAELPVPILLVQHITRGFAAGLADWLSHSVRLRVKLATAGELALPGHVYLAPDDWHMGISRNGRIVLTDVHPEGGFRPSISHLLRSVATAYGPRSLGILLTGMGSDGVSGLRQIRLSGGCTIAQDEASCVIFGMPAKAIEAGAAQQVLSPTEITRFILEATQRR